MDSRKATTMSIDNVSATGSTGIAGETLGS